MFCTKCGSSNQSDACFCFKCGSPLRDVEVTGQTSPQSDQALPAGEATQTLPLSSASHARRSNFILKHWRGDYSLGFSYWIIGSLLSAVVIALTAWVGSTDEIRQLDPIATGLFILSFYTFVVILTLWQFVGVWRSAEKHTQRGGKAGWAALAKVMVVLGKR